MTMAGDSSRVGGIDPAALSAATLAAAISAIAPAGPYGPVAMMIGATVLILILAYDVDPHRTQPQSMAFGAVFGLIFLLTIGFPLEIAFSVNPSERFSAIFSEIKNDHAYSEVPPYVAFLVWLSSGLFVLFIDRRRVSRAKAKKNSAVGSNADA
jgi:hypothetical protein